MICKYDIIVVFISFLVDGVYFVMFVIDVKIYNVSFIVDVRGFIFNNLFFFS